jgi:hypothetical protein
LSGASMPVSICSAEILCLITRERLFHSVGPTSLSRPACIGKTSNRAWCIRNNTDTLC